MTVSPVFSEDSAEFQACDDMNWKKEKKDMRNCFRDLARTLQAALESQVAAATASPEQIEAAETLQALLSGVLGPGRWRGGCVLRRGRTLWAALTYVGHTDPLTWTMRGMRSVVTKVLCS